jgi:hypothetical protein
MIITLNTKSIKNFKYLFKNLKVLLKEQYIFNDI